MILEEKIEKWLELSHQGKVEEAREYYMASLFSQVIERFEEKYSNVIPNVDVLFSVLGFSPEPIILTQRALRPKRHIIFHFNKDDSNQQNDAQVMEVIRDNLTSNWEEVDLKDESFQSIYFNMRHQLDIAPSKTRALDITGGKKSMVASAAIFGRDFDFNILYVDYEKYDPSLRRPRPGTELLNVVYAPQKDLPELLFPQWQLPKDA